jgi:hypothetical protein
MAVSVTHAHQTVIPDDAAYDVGADEWNAAHTITATDGKLLGASGSTTVGEVTVGTGLSLAAGTLSCTVTDTGISNVVEDTTPQLGGGLDLNTFDVTGTGNINITGAITASTTVTGADVTASDDIQVGDDLLFPNSGSVLNFGTGDVTITYTANALTVAGGNFFIVDEAYDASAWDNNLSIPTKNAVRDYVETLTGTTLPATYQPLDGDLTSWAGVTRAAGFDTFTATPSQANFLSLITDDSFLVSANLGVTVQAYDADLASWAGVTRASGFDTFAATPSSANLDALVTDDTGSGALVFATSPTLVTPILGTPTSGTLSNCDAASTGAKGVVELATAAEYRTGTDTARVVGVAEVWSSPALVALSSSSNSTAVDFSTFINASLSLGENTTLANPSNEKVGQCGVICITATGSTRTVALHADYKPVNGLEAFAISVATTETVHISYWIQAASVIIITGVGRRTT